MSGYNAQTYLIQLFFIMGQVFDSFFNMPLFTYSIGQYQALINVGDVILYDFIITLIVCFVFNLPTQGVTINARISRKNKE